MIGWVAFSLALIANAGWIGIYLGLMREDNDR